MITEGAQIELELELNVPGLRAGQGRQGSTVSRKTKGVVSTSGFFETILCAGSSTGMAAVDQSVELSWWVSHRNETPTTTAHERLVPETRSSWPRQKQEERCVRCS